MVDVDLSALSRSLFVASIGEVSNNDLQIVVVEGMAAEQPTETLLGPALAVKPVGRAFELTWWGYVAYGVRNESYFKRETSEEASAGPFGEREGSAYLRYVSESTFASDDYPGPLRHWFLYTEWHCIDVVATDPPKVREITTDEVQWTLVDQQG